MLSRLRHCHLVSLIGYCNDGQEMILVYEYMPHGTLEDQLHKIGVTGKTPLSWLQRLKICLGAARGLDYLHTVTGIQHGVIHRDVKSSNILLDESWAAKISDFGLSKIGPINQQSTYVNTRLKGTFGYIDPDYYNTGRLTRKSDVYAFGVILFEVLCGRPAVDTSLVEEQWGLVGWAQDSIKEGKLGQIMDSSLRGQILPKCLKEFVQIAEHCLHTRPKQRPTMDEVVVSLANVLALQERTDNSLQSAGIMTFTVKVKNIFFGSVGGNSAHGDAKPSRKNNKSTLDGDLPNKDMLLNKDGDLIQEVPLGGQVVISNLKEFKFAQLKSATKNFHHDMMLGEGGFWMVFLGWVNENTYAPSVDGTGMPIAVKKLGRESIQGYSEWLAEVNILKQLRHSNIITLLGYCMDNEECLLVYEYMPNRSLDHFIHRKSSAQILPWATRLKIVLGAGRGLTFLHTSENQIIHRDVKCSNIFLDQDFNAKLGDFCLARSGVTNQDTHVTTRVMGTYGYAAPEYMATGQLSTKSDVYGFGVVLLETLTGLRVIDPTRPSKEQNLVDWTRPLLSDERKLKRIIDPGLEGKYPSKAAYQYAPLLSDERKLKRIIDPGLEGKYPSKAAFQYALLILKCLQDTPRGRPPMDEVVNTLEQINAIDK